MTELTLQRAGGPVVCETCLVADRPLARMRGLLGRRSLAPGEGILLRPASSVHTFFMRFPIDVVFVDADWRVVAIHHALQPWRTAVGRGARAAVELAAGEAERHGLCEGDQLEPDPHRSLASRAVFRARLRRA